MNDRSRSIKPGHVRSGDFDEPNFDSEDTSFPSNLSETLANFSSLAPSKGTPNLAGPKKGSGSALKISQQNSTQYQERKNSFSLGNFSAGDADILFKSGKFSIEKIDEDKYKLIRAPNPIVILVLSGGGAKGLAYPGAILALEEEGHLSTIQDIHAASIGALAGVLLAAGMTPKEFKELSDQINLMDLISKSKDSPPQNGFLKNTPFGLIKTLLTNIGTTAPKLNEFIDENVRKTIMKRIDEKKEDLKNMPLIKEIFNELKKGKEGKNITFKDLEILNKYIPEIKRFHCTATAYFDSDEPQPAVLSAATTPDLSVSDAACASGALPILFSKITFKENPSNPTIFHKAKWADGGLLMNTPVPSITNGIGDPSQCLIFAFENDELNQAMQNNSKNNKYQNKSLLKKLIEKSSEKLIKAPYKFERSLLYKKLSQSPYKDNLIIVPLKNIDRSIDFSGSKGRLALNMEQNDKNNLQDMLYKATSDHLKKREAQKIETVFSTIEELIYSLNDDEFNNLSGEAENSIDLLSEELKNTIAKRKQFSEELSKLATSIENIFTENIKPEEKAEKILQLIENEPESKKAKEFIINKITEYYFQGLELINSHCNPEKLLADKSQENCIDINNHKDNSDLEKIYFHLIMERTIDLFNKNFALLKHPFILEKILEINIKNITNFIIENLIYPEKNKIIQPNMNCLLKAEENLKKAKTKNEINNAINTLINEYKLFPPMNNLNPSKKIKFSEFLIKAQAYKLNPSIHIKKPNNSIEHKLRSR